MALIINPNDKFVKYKYCISEFYIIINGVSTPFPVEKVESFIIENFYEDAIFPIFKLNLMMEASRYFDIIENKDNVKFKIRIQGFHTDMNDEHKSLSRDIINDLFVVFIDDDNADYEKDRKKKAGTYNDKDQLEKSENRIELFLFQDKIVNKLRSLFNGVFYNTNVSTVMSYLLQCADAKNVLMSPFDNTKVYDNIVLPPMSIENHIRYLSNNYGFHKSGTLFFFGLEYAYIIACNGECTAYENPDEKETIIYVLDANNMNSMQSGPIIKYNDVKSYINISSKNIDISTESVSSNVITGINADIVNLQTGETSEVEISAATVGNVNKGVIFNDTSNPYMESVYESLKQSNSISINIGMRDCNIMTLTPNRSVSLIFESPSLNEKYKGKYRIASCIHTFSGNNQDFDINSVITIKKVL